MGRTKSKYAQKRNDKGGDTYGTWNNGKQINAEKINGRMVRYENGVWK